MQDRVEQSKQYKAGLHPAQNICPSAFIVIFIVLFEIIFPFSKAHADTIPDVVFDFFNRINPIYKEKKETNPFDQIPDGGTLLLRPRSENLFLDEDIYGIKKGNGIYLSLSDVIYILDFAIDYDDDTASGQGWFLREDWDIDINLQDQIVISRDKQIRVSPESLIDDGGQYFVKTQELEKWFNVILSVDTEQQVLNIDTPFPIPAIARAHRKKQEKQYHKKRSNIAELPRYTQTESNFDINTADISFDTRFQKRSNNDWVNNTSVGANIQGEILKHNAYLFTSADKDKGLNILKGRLFKKSEKPDLLGSLKARRYAFGDINEVKMPIMPTSDENLGFVFSNTTIENTDFATTDIRGQLFEGWDVQLYRDGILIDAQLVPANGQYEFLSVQLFAGDNNFELFFFGPQGEIRSKSVSVPISPALLSNQDDTYEVSLSLQDTQTYKKGHQTHSDSYTPTVTAKYNRLIGDNHLAYFGFKTLELFDDRKFLFTTGATSTLGRTLLDTGLAIDQNGEYSALAIVRRNLLGWNTSFKAQLNSDDFSYQRSDANERTVLDLSANLQRVLTFGSMKGSVLLNGSFKERSDGRQFYTYNLGLSNQILGASLSNQIRYTHSEASDTSDITGLEHFLSLRKNFGNFFGVLTTTYALKPERELKTVKAQLNYRYDNTLSADITHTRQLTTDIDTTRLNVNYIHDQFRLSPFIEYQSNHDIVAGLGLNFSLYDDPSSRYPGLTHRRLTGRSSVSALVYYDKNGNLVFDNDDEPVKDAILESINSRGRAQTNEQGYATIYDLSTAKATDITVNQNQLPDPFMIPASKGQSVYPREGSQYKMQFPVHMTGEIDGTVFVEEKAKGDKTKTGIGFQKLKLLPLTNPDQNTIMFKAERDGYYIAYMIPPGDYLLLPAETKKYGNLPARIISIGYQGDILKDINIAMKKDAAYVPYEVSYHGQKRDDFTQSLDTIHYSYVMKVKEAGQSELSKTLLSFINTKAKTSYKNLVKIDEKTTDDGTYSIYTGKSLESINTPDLLHNACQKLRAKMVECSIVVEPQI